MRTPSSGLNAEDAARRLRENGPNEIRRAEGVPPWRLMVAQFTSPVVLLLLGASVVSAALAEVVNSLAIAAIVLVNGLIGFFQEYRAERAVLALRAMTAPRARVIRDGRTHMVLAAEVVPGDLLVLEAGDIIAADGRVIEANALTVNEAALTGESVPADKSTRPCAPDAPLAERHDQVFLGTAVATGSGMVEAMATGMHTELGKIAHLLASAQDEVTPLQRRLAKVSHTLLYICLSIVGLVGVLGALRGMPTLEIFMSAVSLAVAAVPEGLPAIVTVALALGVQRMARRNVLIRRLPAVETLGCATVICTDKTGTLTTGVMAVRELWGPDHRRLLDVAAANCDAELDGQASGGIGDPTEIAILVAAARRGIHRSDLERHRPRLAVNPFDAERKRMSIRRADGNLYVKGAVETVLPLCVGEQRGCVEANAYLAASGLRVLAVAIGRGEREETLELVGLIGIADPPRTEAIDAIEAARAAGIRTVMITGDNAVTARAIAHELGILRPDQETAGLVHARATPQDKLRIVREWKSQGAVVAMTGDGVNDAPALREAHIGIAMGRGGTEVTREASDMILSDDNFASIVAAVEEGRGIFDNIRRTLVYLLAGNAGELLVMFSAALVGLPLPLLPLHLLWINLVTDGLPALALVTEPVGRDVMQRPPRPADEPILGWPEWRRILAIGTLEATVTLAVFVWALQERDLAEARNLAFSTLVFAELLRSFSARSSTQPFWEIGLFTNVRLLGIVVVSLLIQLGIHHIPATQELFQIGSLGLMDCAMSLAIAFIPVTILELSKLLRRTNIGLARGAP